MIAATLKVSCSGMAVALSIASDNGGTSTLRMAPEDAETLISQLRIAADRARDNMREAFE